MKKKLIIATIICLGLVGTASAGFYMSKQDKVEIAVMFITKKLDLNNQQIDKLNVIVDAFEKAHEEHAQKRDEHKQQIIEMIQSDQIDQAKIQEMLNLKLQIIAEKSPEFIDKIADFHSLLSAEQKQIIVDKINQHKSF